MMQSISHWGQFEMDARSVAWVRLSGHKSILDFSLNAEELRALKDLPEPAVMCGKPTSFFVSRQDPKEHPFY